MTARAPCEPLRVRRHRRAYVLGQQFGHRGEVGAFHRRPCSGAARPSPRSVGSADGAQSRRRSGRCSLSVARARCNALFTDATLPSSSSAVSAAGQPSTSRRISTARCRGGRCWIAARNASSIVSRAIRLARSARRLQPVRERLQPRRCPSWRRDVVRQCPCGEHPCRPRGVEAGVGGDPVQPGPQVERPAKCRCPSRPAGTSPAPGLPPRRTSRASGSSAPATRPGAARTRRPTRPSTSDRDPPGDQGAGARGGLDLARAADWPSPRSARLRRPRRVTPGGMPHPLSCTEGFRSGRWRPTRTATLLAPACRTTLASASRSAARAWSATATGTSLGIAVSSQRRRRNRAVRPPSRPRRGPSRPVGRSTGTLGSALRSRPTVALTSAIVSSNWSTASASRAAPRGRVDGTVCGPTGPTGRQPRRAAG